MGQWKISTLIARDSKSGKWEVLDGPDEGRAGEHCETLQKMTTAKGKYKEKQYDLAMLQIGYSKRRKFSRGKPMPKIIRDDLSDMAELELKTFIKDHKIKVKFDKDHDKVRAAIRDIYDGAVSLMDIRSAAKAKAKGKGRGSAKPKAKPVENKD